jgi:flagellar biosynthesis protein FliR
MSRSRCWVLWAAAARSQNVVRRHPAADAPLLGDAGSDRACLVLVSDPEPKSRHTPALGSQRGLDVPCVGTVALCRRLHSLERPARYPPVCGAVVTRREGHVRLQHWVCGTAGPLKPAEVDDIPSLDLQLATLPIWAFAFVLVTARMGAAMSLLPGLGESEPPVMVRVGLTLCVTVLLLPGIAPSIQKVPEAGMQAALMVMAEVITGLWLGWLARLLVLALPIAGQFIAYMLGIANVLQPDPELGSQATPLERMFDLGAAVVVLGTGLYALPLMALAGSYQLVPPGTLLPAADTALTAVRAVGTAFSLSVRLASPFLLISIVWHVGTGLLARLVPRMQVYFVVMPGQILGGLVLLSVTATALLAAWEGAVRTGFNMLPGN